MASRLSSIPPRLGAALLAMALGLAPACARGGRASSPSLAGRWEGALHAGPARQPVVLDVRVAGDTTAALLRVPDQLRVDSAVSVRTTPRGVEVTLGGERERLTLRGTRRGDTLALAPAVDTTSGPPHLAPQLELHLVRRGPVPPAPYVAEDVTVPSDAGPLRGVLARPTGRGPHPAIVLVHGSGAQTRHALLPLARHFAEHGIAALAYDKRPITRVGNEDLTSGDALARDALAAVALLRARADVRGDRIGLWGGSQGSGVAARAAARAGGDVAFVVSVSGGGTPYTPFVQYQTGHRLRARGLAEPVVAEALALVAMRHAYLRTGRDSAALAARLRAARPRLAGTGLALDVPGAVEREAWARAGHFEEEAAAPWRGVRVPVLALWGARDRVVPPMESAAGVRDALRVAANGDATVCVVPEADHGMMLPGGPGRDGSFAFPRLAPAYRDGMVLWVRERTGLPVAQPAAAALAARGCR